MNASTITDAEIKGLIDKWGIARTIEVRNAICPRNVWGAKAIAEYKALMPLIKEVKPRILAILAEREAQAEAEARAARARVDAIPGLAEIRNAQASAEEYHRAFNAAFNSEDACVIQARLVEPTTDNIGALLAKYPAAAAYQEAERNAYKSCDYMVAAGRKAMSAIEANPACYADAIATMRATISVEVDRAMRND